MSTGKAATSAGNVARSAEQTSEGLAANGQLDEILKAAKKYARENPESAAMWCLGVGFVLGWKLKPW